MEPKADIALIGLAVMGQNLILNMNDHGYTVVAYNRTVEKVDEFLNDQAKGRDTILAPGQIARGGGLQLLKTRRRQSEKLGIIRGQGIRCHGLELIAQNSDGLIPGGPKFAQGGIVTLAPRSPSAGSPARAAGRSSGSTGRGT